MGALLHVCFYGEADLMKKRVSCFMHLCLFEGELDEEEGD